MNWSPSELYLEEGSSRPSPASAVAENAEMVEIEAPVSAAAAAPPPSDPGAGIDPIAYASLLKQKLDLYCAAVAMSRSSSADLLDTRPQTSGSPQHQSQTNLNGGGSTAIPASTMLQNSVVQGRTIASVPSTVISDDDELDGEVETTENVDVAHMKRVRRMLSNRESARRSRRRKQVHVNELETQVSQLRVENSSLLKRLSNMTQKYNEAAAHNTTLKADVEILRAQVKIAEDTVKRVTGKRPAYPARSSSTITTPFLGISSSEKTSDSIVSVPDKSTHLSQASADDEMVNTCLLEIASALPVEDNTPQTAASGKMDQPGSIRRVASLEHLQKRICSGPRS